MQNCKHWNCASYSNASSSFLDASQFASDSDQVALFRLISAVRIWKMDVATRFFHNAANGITSTSNNVRMVCVAHFHF
jgi:hypothetical protein